ncbi:MAG: competence/damage-inducible protein A [Melioribacteraceae bacterium]|nr:competence/damage-inducible protein A [Melioribacteraceae bacterium]
MNAHLVTIGDEILIGQTINTNSAFIGEVLSDLGVIITEAHVVQDDADAILKEFDYAFKNNDVIIVTGGLGPTHDDITRACIVKYFNTELVMNDLVLSDVKKIFDARGRVVTKINEEQALVPFIAEPIRNMKGTAPGIFIEKDNKVFIAMPGVPYEMKEMMHNFVLPRLSEKINNKGYVVKKTNLLTTGIPESYLFEKLGDMTSLLNGGKMAFLPSQFGVRLRITVKEETEEQASNKLVEIEQKIRAIAGRFIYGKNNDTLEQTVGKILTERVLRIAVAESCTGGLIANRLTNIAGSSSFFDRGVVAYSNAAKVELLKVNEDMIHKYGAVSIEVARQMAEGIKAISGTDLGLSITGIMGPSGGTLSKPVGLVYVGICDDKICTAKEFRHGDDRLLNKDRASQSALDMLRKHLLGIQYDD